jgi:hypothetical protein
MQRCAAKTKTGTPCRAPAGEGGLCYFHANPGLVRELGRTGGTKNRRGPIDLQVPDNMTLSDLRNVQVQAIRLLLSGEMHAREAGALAQLCNSLHRVIPTADLEARVAMLEAQVAPEEIETMSRHSSGSSEVDQIIAGETFAGPETVEQRPDSIDADTFSGTAGDTIENTNAGTSPESRETGEV